VIPSLAQSPPAGTGCRHPGDWGLRPAPRHAAALPMHLTSVLPHRIANIREYSRLVAACELSPLGAILITNSYTPVRNDADGTAWALSCPHGHQLKEPHLSHGGMRRLTPGRLRVIPRQGFLGRRWDERWLWRGNACWVQHRRAGVYESAVPPMVLAAILCGHHMVEHGSPLLARHPEPHRRL